MSRAGAAFGGVGRSALRALPESLVARLLQARTPSLDWQVPPPVRVADAPVRLLVAPANYAGQGHAWARSADRLQGVAAANLEVAQSGGHSFPADARVGNDVFVWSRKWARAQGGAVEALTHVLIEAERPILGRARGLDVRREARWLDAHGVARAYVSHGSDLRLPSRHADLDRWSPFRDPDWDLVPALEEAARRNAAFLAEEGRPVFVSTPELVLDVPDAQWLPVVVDPSQWSAPTPPLSGPVPVVFHAPTNARSKGTLLVAPALEALDAAGVISYRPASGIRSEEMPELVKGADIVLDQFRVGSYGVAACEAMAAGRIVVGHISDQVRAAATVAAGMPLPIVEADPDSFDEVIRGIVADPDRYRALAATGPAFVSRIHDGTHSGRVLESFLR